MDKKTRRDIIVDYLKDVTFAQFNDILALLETSNSTLKRDLAELDNEGLIRRTRGGAMIVDTDKIDVAYLTKLDTYVNDSNKLWLAKEASVYLVDNMSIFMDSSSTVLHMIPSLKVFDSLNIVTNSVLTATLLSEYTNNHVNIIGGRVSNKKFTVHSGPALDQLDSYHFDIAFVSGRGYDMIAGLSEITEGEAIIKRHLPLISDNIIALVTDDKVGNQYFHKSLSIDDINKTIINTP